MASERALKTGVIAAGLALAAIGAAAARVTDSPRLLVLCALTALPAVVLFGRCLGRLSLRPPLSLCEPGALAREQQELVDDSIMLEARLEHAPIAIFRIEHFSGAGPVAPLNANARRLVAPGRASDAGALYQLLQEQAIDARSMIAFDTERGVERALVSVSALTVHGQSQRLVALMPVESELEAEALNAWQQLVHVLTHEIMNSLTPVASLSRTAFDLLDELRPQLPPDASADLATALDAISRRADSLVEFVASYRSLSNMPPARPQRMRLADTFARVSMLVAPAWQARGGRVEFSVEPASLELMADSGQLEQALINLIKNAAEATASVTAPQVVVGARLARGGRLRIDVTDNGSGVPERLIPHIFTPFFSTKKQGGGIGLAMVRHLVHGNGGTVRYAKSVSAGARFVITF
jgi:signal transduction histidine kinase